jgi:hypothetical protein
MTTSLTNDGGNLIRFIDIYVSDPFLLVPFEQYPFPSPSRSNTPLLSPNLSVVIIPWEKLRMQPSSWVN